MIRHVLQRLLVAGIRFAAAAIAILVLIELSFVLLGDSEVHAWEGLRGEDRAFSAAAVDFVRGEWESGWRDRLGASGRVLLLAGGGTLWVGYAWGILGARLRRFRAPRLLAAGFAALACAPGFWLVILAAVYSYFSWDRPGFADDLVVEEGPDLLVWWNAAVVALPAASAAIAWQILAVARAIEGESAVPWLRGLSLAGADGEEIFYRHALRRARGALLGLLDGALPALLGATVVLEVAFHYPGWGALLVDSIRSSDLPTVYFCALGFAAAAAIACLVREILSPPPGGA